MLSENAYKVLLDLLPLNQKILIRLFQNNKVCWQEKYSINKGVKCLHARPNSNETKIKANQQSMYLYLWKNHNYQTQKYWSTEKSLSRPEVYLQISMQTVLRQLHQFSNFASMWWIKPQFKFGQYCTENIFSIIGWRSGTS